jgi:hypothetical protein
VIFIEAKFYLKFPVNNTFFIIYPFEDEKHKWQQEKYIDRITTGTHNRLQNSRKNKAR